MYYNSELPYFDKSNISKAYRKVNEQKKKQEKGRSCKK